MTAMTIASPILTLQHQPRLSADVSGGQKAERSQEKSNRGQEEGRRMMLQQPFACGKCRAEQECRGENDQRLETPLAEIARSICGIVHGDSQAPIDHRDS
jgi:hypothetical protein